MGLPQRDIVFLSVLGKQLIEPGAAQPIGMRLPVFLEKQARGDMRPRQFREEPIEIRQRNSCGFGIGLLFGIQQLEQFRLRKCIGQGPGKLGGFESLKGIKDTPFGNLERVGDPLVAETSTKMKP